MKFALKHNALIRAVSLASYYYNNDNMYYSIIYIYK